jgi:hypothetical protein
MKGTHVTMEEQRNCSLEAGQLAESEEVLISPQKVAKGFSMSCMIET